MGPWLIGGALVAAVGGLVAAAWRMFAMPGEVYDGPIPDADEEDVRRLKRHIETLATDIGERRVHGYQQQLDRAACYIEDELTAMGLRPKAQTFMVGHEEVRNIEVEFRGALHFNEIVVVGAHYDSAHGTPGANDNGSGVAALLELARKLAQGPTPLRTVRCVFFVNEEAPFFDTDLMGSKRYAQDCAMKDEKVRAMLCLETIGYYTDEPDSQHYPEGVDFNLPTTGNFVGVVGNIDSAGLVRDVVGAFRATAPIATHGVAMPSDVPGVGWSDHASFWDAGYKAVMITDSAPYRYPHYHTDRDTPDKIDYDALGHVLTGLHASVLTLSS